MLKYESQKVVLTESFSFEKFNEIEALGAKRLFFSFDVWADIVSENFQNHSIVWGKIDETGRLGKLNEIELFTDGYRLQEARSLKPKTIYWFK